MTKCSEWPQWFQILILVPHSILGFVAFWLWWPKSDEGWRKFLIVNAYLLVFYLVMHFGFKCW